MIKIRIGEHDDLLALAQMNKFLIEDEQADVDLTIDELKDRMKDFIVTDYTAYVFYENKNILGYALVALKEDPVYLKHFFINRAFRRKGFGTKAFKELMKYLKLTAIDIEVFDWNEIGMQFWNSLGFEPRYIRMRYKEE